jgi:hypothetical protein
MILDVKTEKNNSDISIIQTKNNHVNLIDFDFCESFAYIKVLLIELWVIEIS